MQQIDPVMFENLRQWNKILILVTLVLVVAVVLLLILWRYNKRQKDRFKRESEGGKQLLLDFKANAEEVIDGERKISQSRLAALFGRILELEYKVAMIHYYSYEWDAIGQALKLFFKVQEEMISIASSHNNAIREHCELLCEEYPFLREITYELILAENNQNNGDSSK